MTAFLTRGLWSLAVKSSTELVALEIPQISPKAIPYFTFGPENRHSRAACKLAQWQAICGATSNFTDMCPRQTHQTASYATPQVRKLIRTALFEERTHTHTHKVFQNKVLITSGPTTGKILGRWRETNRSFMAALVKLNASNLQNLYFSPKTVRMLKPKARWK